MTKKRLLYFAAVIFILQIVVLIAFGIFTPEAERPPEAFMRIGPFTLFRYGMELEDITAIERWNLDGTPEGEPTFWALNRRTTIMILIVDAIILIGAFITRISIRKVPGRLQGVFESIVQFFMDIVNQTLGPHGERHLPMLGTLFIFLFLSNIIGIIPFAYEPTRDVNVPIGHMLAVLTVVHFEAIRVKGFVNYLKSYIDPFFIMAPLNIVGELAKGVSLAFRLFGNMLGSAIILMVITFLVRYTVISVGLNLFFGLFIGAIQAFVFTMLSMTYIAVAIAD